ncbi:MAG TPA: isocitrate lyase/phosphoenolpyruvate mutase family protein [Rhizomicrobium sp.]|nr:isocitrate lyase/phosphoenolpyruvate mutase family protein [Rhizomicrobium sp.]
MTTQSEQTAKFRALHDGFLVLPNAWDAASAMLSQEAGAQAIATSSAAVAWCQGYSDGEKMPRAVALAAAKEVIRIARVPVSVDSEAGYGGPDKAAAHVLTLIEMGAAGINIEDGKDAPDVLVAKIKAIKAAAKAKGADIFINARTDVYLQNLVADADKRAESIRRGRLYRDAGADGLFVPWVTDTADMRAIADAVKLPLNVLVRTGLPEVPALKAAGARRLSAGALIGRAAYGAAQLATKMLLDEGKYDAIFATSSEAPNFNPLFS